MNKKIVAALVIFLSLALFGTTWVDVELVCPICGSNNTFEAVASYGNYIYGAPSRFQLVFFPYTSDEVVYTCKQCRFSVFEGDFDEVPASEIDSIRMHLQQSPLPEPLRQRGEVSYTALPTWARLLVAEQSYKILGRDKQFWCHFYRVLGYHAAAASKPDLARQSRSEALRIADEILSGEDVSRREQKEMLMVQAAMSHYTGSDDKAIEYLRKAQSVKHPQIETEAYYQKFIPEYIGQD